MNSILKFNCIVLSSEETNEYIHEYSFKLIPLCFVNLAAAILR